MNKTLALIPTYNEAENIEPLYEEIKKLKIKLDILFVDDNSPDGTSRIIAKIQRRDKAVKLILRKGKEGIGSAHLEGIKYAYKNRYSILITLDCDFTHKPEDLPRLIKSNTASIIIGSRYLSANSLSEWNLLRKSLTNMGHFLTKNLLGMSYDATSAFRLYNLNKIPENLFSMVESRGYSFFFESLFILCLNNHTIKEIPIRLPARTYGTSKMTIKDAWNSLRFLLATYLLSKVYHDSYIYSPPILRPGKRRGEEEREWDEYWHSERKHRKILYDTIATFYRKYIIKKNLTHYIVKTFKKGSSVLHAGCGSGQVDENIINFINITALDISTGALSMYKRIYKDSCNVLHGNILDIPVKNGSFDGIYNLGVMEHFTKKDIKKILGEFHRVLKKRGKILLFWPPQFGLSVIFLNSMHFILNKILGKNIRLHPHEITKVRSKKQIREILEESHFKLKGFYFGPQDLFTYVIIIAEKSEH